MPSLKSIAVVVWILGIGGKFTPPPPPVHKRYHRHPMHNMVNVFSALIGIIEIS